MSYQLPRQEKGRTERRKDTMSAKQIKKDSISSQVKYTENIQPPIGSFIDFDNLAAEQT